MRLSGKKIAHAVMVRDRRELYLNGLRRVALVEELGWFGVTTPVKSDLDSATLREIYLIVVERVCRRYGY